MNDVAKIAGALEVHDRLVAACPIDKPMRRVPKVCQKCGATPSDSCPVKDRAASIFVDAVRFHLQENPHG